MKKILFILNSNGVGGAEVSIKRMCESYFTDADVLTMWGHPNVQKDFWKFSHNGRVVSLSDKKLSIIELFKIIHKLINYINNNNYDVIQTQLKGADIIIGLLVFFKLIKKKKLIASLRNSFDYYYGGSLKNKIIGKVHKILLKLVYDRIVVISLQDLEKFKTFYGDKLVVIENGINYKNFKAKKTYDFDKEEIKIAMVGNIKYRKGYDRLIELFDLMKNEKKKYVFNIAGGVEDNNLLEFLLESSKRYKNIEVIYNGKVSNINSFLLDNDIFLSLSRMEGLPISVLEAMAVKLPIILSDIEAHKLIVDNEISNSVLFNNIEQCYKNIKQINKNFNLIVEKQYNLLENRFNFKDMCNKYNMIYYE